jgi:hypothetical protein
MWFLLWVDNGGFRYVKLRKNDGSALIAYLSKLRQKPAGRPYPRRCTGVEIYRGGVKHEHYYCHETAFHIDYSRFRHLAAQLAKAGFVKRLRRSVYVLPLHSRIWLFSKINEELVVSLYGGLEAAVVDVNDVARLIDVFTSNKCVVAYNGERCNGRRCTESSFSIICKDRAANVIADFVEKYKIRWGQDYDKFNVPEGMDIEYLFDKWEQKGEASRELLNVLRRFRKEGWLSERLYVYKAELRGGDIDGDVATSIMIAKEVLKKTALIFGRRVNFISDSIA